MELQRLSLSQGCQNCYFVFTQLEFLLANCHGAYGYQGHFFHYPRVCLQSHVGKLHLYLCQWKKFPSGNISRHQGKPFQFTEIERRGSLSCLRFLQLQPKKKKKVLFYFPEISPSPTPACPAGRTGMVCSTSCQVQAIFRSLRQPSSPLPLPTLQHKQTK